jgi:hypothetical protein
MLDFWELLGHVVAEDGFRASVLGYENRTPTLDPACECRAIFNPNDFDGMREVVAAAHPEIPMSLIALGEWMLIKTLSPIAGMLGNISAIVKPAMGAAPSQDRQFYQALGLSVIDQTFGAVFGPGNLLGFDLNPADMAVITGLNADQAGFRAAANTFHNVFWGIDCKAWMFTSGASPRLHVHPLDPDEQTLLAQLPAGPQP